MAGASTATKWTLHLAMHAPPSGQVDFDGVSQQGQSWTLSADCACMAFMQSLGASEGAVLAVAFTAMPTSICSAAMAELIGASDSDRAIRIARMGRCRFRATDPLTS